MKSKMVSIFLCIVMVASIFAALTQNLGLLSMNASAVGGLADSPWPMFRHNLNHTGVSPYNTSANNGQLKWTFETGDIIWSSPAIGSDGTIYIGSSDNNLYAINPDGTEKWNFTTGDRILRSSPAIDSDGTIYVGSHDHNLYAINPDGTEKWSFTTNAIVKSSPAIGSDGTIYVGSSYKLFAINPDGTEKWIFATGSIICSSPAIGFDETIYIGSDDYKIYAVYPDGTEKWNLTTGNAVISSPAISSDGTIYVGSTDGKLYAINPDGTEKWNFNTGQGVHSSPAIGSDGTIYIGSKDYRLYAINPDGTEKWNFLTGDFIFHSSPAISSEGTIYIGSQDYKLYAINPDGSKKWSYTTGFDIVSSPAIGSDGTIYVGSYDHKLYAIGAPNLKVNVTSHFTTLNSAAQSFITVTVTNGTNPVQGATVNLVSDNGGMFSPQSGTTDINGNFTSIFNAPTVTTQIICRITAEANKTGYNNGSGYVEITIKPIPWPMFSHNCWHTGQSPYDTSSNPGLLKWSFMTGGHVKSSPVIGSDSTIYVGSDDNKLYAINPDGTQKWNFTTGHYVFLSPAIDSDGTIYVGSYDHKMYAINPDGTQKWNFTTGNSVYSSPAIGSDGTIYCGSADNKLYAINPNGTQKWNFTTGTIIYNSSPTIGVDGTIYIGSLDKKLYAINPNGTQKWNFTSGDLIYSSPAIDFDGTIYVGSTDKKLYAINPNGTQKWNFTSGDLIYSSPAIDFDGTIYVGSLDKKLYAVNPNGTQKWNFTTGGKVWSSPAIGNDGTIYLGSDDHKLYAVNPDGTQKWNFTSNDMIRLSPAINSDGTIYVGSWDYRLYAIGKAVIPPTLYINVSQDGEDAILYWDQPQIQGIDHYLIYRSTSQTNFDFNTIWVNTSKDNESGEPGPIPLRTMWNDTKAALPSNKTNYEEQYYYIIRAVDVLDEVSITSRTVGKWTKTFPQGVSTFSLPLEPLETMNPTTDYYLKDMNARYIKWMNPATNKWMQHGDGFINDVILEVGRGYEVAFDTATDYTFTGMPAAMIRHGLVGFTGFNYDTDAKSLRVINVNPAGDVTLEWNEPVGMDPAGGYHVYYSTTRDGFDDGSAQLLIALPTFTRVTTHAGAAASEAQYYYMVVAFNNTGVEGSSTYSIGVWTEEYLSGYDTFGIPLKMNVNHTADWYCDNMPDVVGINYFIFSLQEWGWHSTRMPEGAFDPIVEMTKGYQISTSNATKFTFIGT